MKIQFIKATMKDIDELIRVQDKAFYEDFFKYGFCPGYGSTREKKIESLQKNIIFKITVDDRIVGEIVVRDKGSYEYFLSCLCVIPEYENLGIGQKAMDFIHTYFADAKKWTLETPADKMRNHYFYKKCGYEIVEEYMDGSVKILLFEK